MKKPCKKTGKALKREFAQQCDLERFLILRRFWPKIFNIKKPPRPLIAGIHQLIIDHHKAKGYPYYYALQELKAYVTREAYYQCLIDTSTRYNLMGLGVAAVTDEEKLQARVKLKRLRKLLKRNTSKTPPPNVKPTPEERKAIREEQLAHLANLDMSPQAVAKRAKERAKEKRQRDRRRARKLADAQKEETPQKLLGFPGSAS